MEPALQPFVTLGQRIALRRKTQAITQVQLAEVLGDFPASDELVREGTTPRARVAAAGHRAGTRHHARCARQRRSTHNSRRAEEARTAEEDSATDEAD